MQEKQSWCFICKKNTFEVIFVFKFIWKKNSSCVLLVWKITYCSFCPNLKSMKYLGRKMTIFFFKLEEKCFFNYILLRSTHKTRSDSVIWPDLTCPVWLCWVGGVLASVTRPLIVMLDTHWSVTHLCDLFDCEWWQ